MSSRRSEIEAKRAKIAELQRLREQRLAASSSGSVNVADTKVASSISHDRQSIDSLVDSLLAGRVGSPSIDSTDSNKETELTKSDDLKDETDSVLFKTVITEVFEVAPVSRSETVTYSKGVQTTEPWEEEEEQEQDDEKTTLQESNGVSTMTTSDETQSSTMTTSSETQSSTMTTSSEVHSQESITKSKKVTTLDKEKIELIKTEKEYTHFIDQSLKVISRALQPTYDILIDYGAHSTEQQETERDNRHITNSRQFYSQYSKGRAITYLDWSTKYSELVASAHTEKNSDPNASKGLVQIWNLNASNRPEYILDANTDILTVKFHSFESNLVFGTGYNGQVISWDLRAGSHPILISPLTGTGHTHPAFTMCLSGTQNANSLLTSSTDGYVCTWTPDILVKPQDRLFLESPFGVRPDEVAPTALAVSPRDTNLFLVGTEKGNILQCNRFAQAGHKAGIDPRAYYDGHLSPVTSMDFHTSRGTLDLSNYMLSCGLDWSIKLWKIRPFTGAVPTSFHGPNSASSASECYQSILDIKREDSVYDVAWHPSHPSIFADVDGQGYLDIWDLAKDIEMPIIHEKPPNSQHSETGSLDSGSANYLNRPLNRLVWSPMGEKIAVGGLDGMVTVFEIDSSLISPPQTEEWHAFKRRLTQLEE